MYKLPKIFCCFVLILVVSSCAAPSITPLPSNTDDIEIGEETQASSENGRAILSPSSLNTILPEDILEEVSWFPGGGPGGGSSQICNTDIKIPFIKHDPQDTELMNQTWMWTCGWQKDQSLNASVTFPNGTVQNQVIYADENGMAKISVAPSYSDPEGIYEFEISDGFTVLKSNAYFRKPIVPRLHLLPGNILRFDNFPANETIRLFLYECTGIREYDEICLVWSFIGWQNYLISDDGSLEISTMNSKDIYYVAVMTSGVEVELSEMRLPVTIMGDESKYYENSRYYGKKSQEYLACPENTFSIESRWGQIVDANDNGIDLYSQPRTSARSIDNLQNGTVFSILLRDPECSDGNMFWYVHVLDSNFRFYQTGYVRLIEPQNSFNFNPIVLGVDKKSYCGDMKSYLSVGDRGKVVSSDSSNLRLRVGPGDDQEIIDLLPKGTPFLTLEGPECIDGVPWWKIYTQTGMEGWAAEYQDQGYLLTLIDSKECYSINDIQDHSRLSIGDTVEVSTEEGTSLRVRSGFTLENSEILFRLPSGTRVVIAEGPVCSEDKYIWWRVVTDVGNTGWVVEYEDGIYYLKKVSNP